MRTGVYGFAVFLFLPVMLGGVVSWVVRPADRPAGAVGRYVAGSVALSGAAVFRTGRAGLPGDGSAAGPAAGGIRELAGLSRRRVADRSSRGGDDAAAHARRADVGPDGAPAGIRVAHGVDDRGAAGAGLETRRGIRRTAGAAGMVLPQGRGIPHARPHRRNRAPARCGIASSIRDRWWSRSRSGIRRAACASG